MSISIKTLTIIALSAVAAASYACSSSSSSSNGGGGASQCASSVGGMPSGSDTQCSSCVQSNCGSQISGFESGCSDYLSCVCPNGSVDQSLIQQCAPKVQESSCTSAEQNIQSCINAHCASQCASGSSSGGSSGSGSGGGSGSGSGSGSSSGGGSGSSSGGAGTTKVSCDQPSMGTCSLVQVPSSEVSAANQSCTSGGGTPGTSCPTTDLVGCCTISTEEACYYGDAGGDQAGCTSAGGTWSTSQ
ncbi:MAG TPA: hypothetical protein VMI75_24715 [Polyangiaceae bacterium]|nr:hypothetical protein [Polyangiaceae bacterium]